MATSDLTAFPCLPLCNWDPQQTPSTWRAEGRLPVVEETEELGRIPALWEEFSMCDLWGSAMLTWHTWSQHDERLLLFCRMQRRTQLGVHYLLICKPGLKVHLTANVPGTIVHLLHIPEYGTFWIRSKQQSAPGCQAKHHFHVLSFLHVRQSLYVACE
jgi:hypothetical protein